MLVVKSILLFSLASLAQSASPTKCPAVDPEDRSILLPDPESCSRFFLCNKGEKIQMYCPPLLEFSVRLNACDLPDEAGCSINGDEEVE